MLLDQLKALLVGKDERVGFVLKTGEIVEVENTSADKENSFSVRGEDLVAYPPIAEASWHTHPGKSSNLSSEDYTAFRNYPQLKHYVIGIDGVRCFRVDKKAIVECE